MDNIERTDAGSEDYRVASSQANTQAQTEAVVTTETVVTPAERARRTVMDIVDDATTDRFVGIESVIEQQSVVINGLRDHAILQAGQIDALSKLVSDMAVHIQVAPTPQPKPVKEG